MSGSKRQTWTTWFTSDTHYGHEAVIRFCNRPFKSVEEMDEAMIDNWNKKVKPEDLCIFVGDVFMYCKPDRIKEILSKLNGDRKILVYGNHDRDRRRMMNLGFTLVVEEMTLEILDENVLLSHYPFRMKPLLYNWIKLKRALFNIIRKTGIPIRKIYLEKYHDRRPIDRGQFLIHGHTHSNHKINGKAIHVGVDAWKYKPVNIEDIRKLILEVRKNGPKYIRYNSNED
jgi:calcineurin-like phosphoesterase family protein